MDAPIDACPDTLPARFDRRELHNLLSSLNEEFCRPLASLRTGFDLLMGTKGGFSTAQQGHVATMRTLCDDMLRLSRSYLEYAEIIRSARPPCLGTFSIRALVREVDRTFGDAARAKGIDWEAVAVAGDALVVTDASRCQQIFAAMASNAVKFTPEGGRIRVEGRAEGDSWSLSIVDDGPGVSPDRHDRVFEPFYRLARDEHSSVEGNGLGLAIGLELAAQLHGRLSLASDGVRGLAIRASFPRSLPPEPPIAIDRPADRA